MTRSDTKRFLALILSVILMCGFMPESSSHAEMQLPSKEEVIYANLSATGAVEKAYVVNIFNLTQAATVTDYGDYGSVVNLTDTAPITRHGMETSFQANSGRFYYQGNLNAKILPWNFSIEYTLDGKSVQPEKLGGVSGKLGIHIESSPNSAIDSGFYDNYMLQISVTLDAQKCTNILADGAIAANAGASKMLTFTVMPKSKGDISITSDVVAFEMPGISINAVPLSIKIDAPNTDGLLGDINRLADSIGLVNTGVTELANGIKRLKNGSYSLKEGVSSFGTGLSTLNGGSASLSKGSKDFYTALSGFASSLSSDGINGGGLGDITALSGGLTALAAQIVNTADGLSSLKSAVDSIAAVLNGLSTPQPAPDINDDAKAADGNVAVLINQYNALAGSVEAAKGCGASLSEISAGIGSAAQALYTIAAYLDTIALQISTNLSASGIETMIQQIQGGAAQLANAYADINTAIDSYTKGVNQLNENFGGLKDGISSIYSGIALLFGGAEELNSGTEELQDKTANMDEQVSDAIDDMLNDYDRSDFVPISFVSARNTNVTSVQFVIQTAAIELPNEEMKEETPKQTDNFWDRLLDLFQNK